MLDFDQATHAYSIQGVRVPSVTQILEDTGIVDFSFIPRETREMALHRGSMVHLACQLYDERDLADGSVDQAIVPYLNAWKRFLVESGFVIEEIEQRGFNERFRYAGTADRIGRLNGMPTIVDIKTNQIPNAIRLQLAAYCEFRRFPTTIGRAGVELHADETYRLVTIPVKQHTQDFNDFCCALRVYQLKREMSPRKEDRKAA